MPSLREILALMHRFGRGKKKKQKSRPRSPSPPPPPPKDWKINHQPRNQIFNQPPIHRLPAEILISIFLLRSDDRAALVLVCRHWTSLINNTGQLWSTIWVFPRKLLPESEYLPRLKMLVERSCSMPLHLVWRSEANMVKEELFDYFFQHAPISRWQSLEVYNWGVSLQSVSRYFSSTGQSILEKVEVPTLSTGIKLLELIEENISLFPLLKSLDTGDSNGPLLMSCPTLLGRIKVLSTPIFNPRIMEVCKSINDLSISTLPGLPCDMQQVRTLRIQRLFNTGLFRHVNIPNLEHLYVNDIRGGQDIDIPSLRTLTFTGIAPETQCYIRADSLEAMIVERPLKSKFDYTDVLFRLVETPRFTLHPPSLILKAPINLSQAPSLLRNLQSTKHLKMVISIKEREDDQSLIALFSSTLHQQDTDRTQLEPFTLPIEENKKPLICPNLNTLYLSLEWAQCDSQVWRNAAQAILEARPRVMEKVEFEWNDGIKMMVMS